MDWKECKDKQFVKEVVKDTYLIESLIKSSKKRLESSKRLKLDNITAPSKISLIYESVREILEAFAIKKGFKIYNHECFCAFLNEICKDKSSSDEFNKFRKIRNQMNYYGREVPLTEAKIIIRELTLFRNKIRGLLKWCKKREKFLKKKV